MKSYDWFPVYAGGFMKELLNADELSRLVDSVFKIRSGEKLAVMMDIPDAKNPDHPEWRARRTMACQWVKDLGSGTGTRLGGVELIAYPNVHNNNADLPETLFTLDPPEPVGSMEELKKKGKPYPVKSLLGGFKIILAPTELSNTAPLKLLAGTLGFRAATMPGFSPAMIPSLRLDYGEIDKRVQAVKRLLDKAVQVEIGLSVEGGGSHSIRFDLRNRTAHASSGLLPEPGTAGNLPSGEAYIAPYEGTEGDESLSEGVLPVQFEEEVVLYRIGRNRAVEVLSNGTFSDRERLAIREEPAYGNIAELGFGILRDFGVRPVGQILLDEKLGLHIAFGRNDHFGGKVGARDFSSPEKVVHIDRIYIPEIQNKIRVDSVKLTYGNKKTETLMKNNRYTLFKKQFV